MRTYRTSGEWLSFYREIATSRGGVCLSDVYVNSKTKLRWVCDEGHAWEAIPENVKAGHWCKVCGNASQGRKKAHSIEWARHLAATKGGECLSTEYRNNRTNLTWRCALGHEWSAQASSIQQGRWCPICVGKKPPDMALVELQEIARVRGGKCMSANYILTKKKLLWQCQVGHKWEAVPDSVRHGTWCPQCAGNSLLKLDDLQVSARDRGGECLSTQYSNSNEKLLWRCAAGHEWKAGAYHVRAGHWCPTCAAGKCERICRDILEQMFGLPFPKSRPSWLLGNKGRTMELDGYCEGLGLAFEYQGHQHYRHIEFFHRGEKNLQRQQQDDEHKDRLCRDRGIHLIAIPYTVPMADVPEFVYRAVNAVGLHHPMKSPSEVKVADFVLPEMIAAMQLLAQERDGECLSNFYVNNLTKLRWRCTKGHEWDAVPGSIQQGGWCPSCAGKLAPEPAYQLLQEIATARGGHCLSESYVHGRRKLWWRCAAGHQWEATSNNIRAGSWCPECAMKIKGPKRLGIEVCQRAALAKGGECLSVEYVNTNTKLRWRCAEGHEWDSIPDSVVRLGTWCPQCMGKRSWETRRLTGAPWP